MYMLATPGHPVHAHVKSSLQDSAQGSFLFMNTQAWANPVSGPGARSEPADLLRGHSLCLQKQSLFPLLATANEALVVLNNMALVYGTLPCQPPCLRLQASTNCHTVLLTQGVLRLLVGDGLIHSMC